MYIEQKKFTTSRGWEVIRYDERNNKTSYDLILAFGSRELLSNPTLYQSIKNDYPEASILMSSTSGEIIDTQVNDDTIALTAIHFEKTKIKTAVVDINNIKNSFEAGSFLASSLPHEELRNVLVISDGHQVNGSELVAGISASLPKDVILTGGLAGDGTEFKKTLVGLNECPSEGKIVAVGFYGKHLLVNSGSMGGWDSFGPFRLITKAEANVLYEFDNKPALDIYKKYLGEYAEELPSAALRFPLSIRMSGDTHTVVRTILSINEEDKSLTFAGNMPIGAYAQLMKANYDRLIDGASNAAQHSMTNNINQPELAILISCVGRKLVLGHRTEEEVEVVRDAYGEKTAITGFYSYGEIAPSFEFMKCELHNQTMTITTLTEV